MGTARSFAFLLLGLCAHVALAKPLAEWTMIDVNSTGQQGDAHLIEFADGTNLLVDTGLMPATLVRFLNKRGIDVLHKVIITHAHRDHYGGLEALLRSRVKVMGVWMNAPEPAACEREKSWGCDIDDVNRVLAGVRERGVALHAIDARTVFYENAEASFRVLYAFDDKTSPVGSLDVNDSSPVAMLRVGPTRALFTGDLNRPLGEYLATHGRDLAADILKVPHHGAESVAPNAFFDVVKPAVALVPSPRSVWESERGTRVRTYFAKTAIPTYVNGLDGAIRVSFFPNGYTVTKGDSARPDLERYGDPVLGRGTDRSKGR